MKGRILSIAIVVVMVLGSFGAVVNLKAKGTNESQESVPGEVIVGFYETIDVKDIDSFEGYVIREKIESLNVAVVQVNEGSEQFFIDNIIDSPLVKYAEYNWVVHAFYEPNDPLWDQQWGPQRIHCAQAWNNGTGSNSVKIAIVDTGVDYNHEDIAGNYVSGGYDWVNNDNDPMDDNNHGTHCAGIAAAVMDNNIGIAGVAQVKIMAEKVLDSGGHGSSSDVASGITHAADNGANIISMSLGSSSPSSVIEDACDYAYNDKGVVLVAASGNDGQPQVSYPAAYDTVIAVGAIDTNDQRCDFSNYGDDLELMAPGYRVVSTIPGNDYDFYTGTSMACPHVAGVAALAKSLYPSQNNVWIRQKLIETAEDLGPAGWDEEYGYGLVDATLGGGSPPPGPKVTVTIHKVLGIDSIEWITGGDPEWYYEVGVDSKSYFEYNGYEQEIIPGLWWIFVWNSENPWQPDKTYTFDAENPEITVKIKLMEHDGILEGGMDDLADVSSYTGWGTDNSIEDVRGAIYQGTYNLITNQLTGDIVHQDGNYLVTSGEYDNNAGGEPDDGNDAAVWFTISDNYNAPKPDLNAYGDLTWNMIKPGATVGGELYVENIGEFDPYGQNQLSWSIAEWPDWGTWTFTPKSGSGLKPEDESFKVDVSVVAPTEKEKKFTGRIKIVNTDDPSDYVYIDVALRTPRVKIPANSLFTKLLERFPFLQNLFLFFNSKDNLHQFNR